jgi:hypothetical protein
MQRFKTQDGRDVALQAIADPRGEDRPPVAVMIYEGDRPVSIHQYRYVKEGKHWRPRASRVTIFGSDGKPNLVVTNDIAAAQFGSIVLPRASTWLLDGLHAMGGSLGRLVLPDVLYAAQDQLDAGSSCSREAAILAGAVLAEAAAVAFLAAAVAACPVTVVTCFAVVAAQLALTAADIALGVAYGDYYNCTHPQKKTTGDGSGAGGSFDGSGDGCFTLDFYVSYDGGNSWIYDGSALAC